MQRGLLIFIFISAVNFPAFSQFTATDMNSNAQMLRIKRNHIKSCSVFDWEKYKKKDSTGLQMQVFYNGRGQRTREIIFDDYGKPDTHTDYGYNAKGNIIEERTLMDSGDSSFIQRKIFEYDSAGFQNRIISYDNDGSVLLVTSNNFDENGILSQSFSYLNDSTRQNMINYEYDDRGNLSKKLVYKWFELDWVLIATYLHIYDQRNNLIEVSLGKLGNVIWSDIYKYDSRGNIIESFEHDPMNVKLKRHHKFVYEY